MLLATMIGVLMVPVTFAVVEYLSHRFRKGGRSTTMDSTHDPEPEDGDDGSSMGPHPQEGLA
jgi:HAE1 family hydrophobic/amphiphilic exporter-1